MSDPRPVQFNPYAHMPASVADLAVWETYACRSFVRVRSPEQRDAAVAAAGSMDFEALARFLAGRAEVWSPELWGYAEDGLPEEDLLAAAAVRILVLRGVRDLRGLWDLGFYYRADGFDQDDWFCTPAGLLDRHRRGFTQSLLLGLAAVKFPWSFAEEWEQRLPVRDLGLALAAGLTGDEVWAVYEGREPVCREEWALLRGLRMDA